MSRKFKKSSGVDGFQRKLDLIRVEAVNIAFGVSKKHITFKTGKSKLNALSVRAGNLPVHDKHQNYEKNSLIDELNRLQLSAKECQDGLRFTTFEIESPDLFLPLADKVGIHVHDSYREQVGVIEKN